LLRTGFEYAGSFEDATIFVDSVSEQIVHCGNIGNYMQLYVRVVDNLIDDIKYTCSCDPAANVAVEILCILVKGKSLEEAAALREDAFVGFLGSGDEAFRKRAENLMELLNKGILRHKTQTESRRE
jgi:NifU-like protein involved in Fe-S cluster formation